MGLPLHVLILHATVILVPLAAVGGLAISTMKWARLRYGSLVLVGTFGAAVCTFVTVQAGQDFAKTFAEPSAEMVKHFSLGGTLLIWVVLLLVGVGVLMLGQQLVDRDHARGKLVLLIGIVVTIVGAVVSIVQVIRVGHSGAVAVWGGIL